jgi:hypothetical protein
MKTILTFYGIHPVLNQWTYTIPGPNQGNRYGIRRDGDEIKNTLIDDKCIEVELTTAMKLTLLQDLAFVYGQESMLFAEKLKEFDLL